MLAGSYKIFKCFAEALEHVSEESNLVALSVHGRLSS